MLHIVAKNDSPVQRIGVARRHIETAIAHINDVAHARVTSDMFSRDVSLDYAKDPVLSAFPVPRLEIKEASVQLRFAVNNVEQKETDRAGITRVQLGTHGTQIAREVVNDFVAASPRAEELKKLIADKGLDLEVTLREAVEGAVAADAKLVDTALKVNISWHFFFPGCSTTPWQLEGVIRAMKQDGYAPDLMHACHNRTVVIDAHLGERENKQVNVVRAHGLRNLHLYEGEEWISVRDAVGDLTKKFLCLNDVYPKGFMIPRRFIGENIIHLPTIKTHVFTTTTGAMKNAFGGLLNERRHWTHPVIHETLVDLLMIQQKIHKGVFAVMDGTFAGDGPGPRCMIPRVKNVILASADQVAIDAVAAKLMGFSPMDLEYIRVAHEDGLGVGDPGQIEVVGYDIEQETAWNFVQEDTFASRGQKMIYHGPLKPLEKILLQSPLVPWSYFASNFYHNVYWYPFVGCRRVAEALNTRWGKHFASYGDGSVVMPGMEPKTVVQAAVGLTILAAAAAGMAYMMTRRED